MLLAVSLSAVQSAAQFDSSTSALAAATTELVIGTSDTNWWSAIPSAAPPSGSDAYEVNVGTKLVFKYSVDHNVYLMASEAHWTACSNWASATELAGQTYGGGPSGAGAFYERNLFEAVATTAGLYYIACEVGDGGHCQDGQKIKVQVTEGPPSPPATPPLPKPPPGAPSPSVSPPAGPPSSPTSTSGAARERGLPVAVKTLGFALVITTALILR